jgi:hypothetical protein
MLRAMMLPVLAFAASCHSGPPQSCKVATAPAQKCLSRFDAGQGHEAVLACFPFSTPEKIEGALYRGFELNVFVESGRASLRDLPKPDDRTTSLEFYTPDDPHDPLTRVYDVQFICRRSQCDMIAPRHWVIPDRIISSKLREISAEG